MSSLNCDTEPIWLATARYGLRPAPGGLALVQDFLNSRASEAHGPDMLRDSANAEVWAAHAVHAWSVQRTHCQPPALTDHDTIKLRDVRSLIEDGLAGVSVGHQDRLFGPLQFTLAGAAEISYVPKGQGWQWFCGAILGEILLSRNVGSWQRMKLCRNPACRAAFYDRTWNISGVWHNPGICGETAG